MSVTPSEAADSCQMRCSALVHQVAAAVGHDSAQAITLVEAPYLDGPVPAAADLAPAEWHMLQDCHRIGVHVLQIVHTCCIGKCYSCCSAVAS